MMKLSMLSLVSVVVAQRIKCESPDPDLGQAQCLITLILLKITDPIPPENSYTQDELKALQECAKDSLCEPQCTCFDVPAEEGGDKGQIWLYTPSTEKCQLNGFAMAKCHPYDSDSDDTDGFYLQSQIDALTTCENAKCCTPTCTCFVTPKTYDQAAGQSWVFTPQWQADCICENLTDISTDPSAGHSVYLNLDGANNNHSNHRKPECTGEEAQGDQVNEFIDEQYEAFASGRVVMNNRAAQGATGDVCSNAQAKSWSGCNVLPVCAKYNAYLESEKEKGLAECYAPADYNVALADDGVTEDLKPLLTASGTSSVDLEEKPVVSPPAEISH